MCGIVGYIGSKNASPILMEGMERLSYRGYDSAGVAVIGPDGKIGVRKAKGRLENLAGLLKESPVSGTIGIGHTRWATHGEPSDLNAHPHTDVKGGIAVVHNGIIENHAALRRHLEQTGAKFVSQTDTEVIAHLLNWLYDGDMKRTLIRAMGMLEGSYALGILCDHEPGDLYCARNDSPLVVGARDGEGFIASDIPALLSHTRDVIFLQDKEIAVLNRQGISVFDAYGNHCHHPVFHVDWDLTSAEKGGYAHYMLKEIHEQPKALRDGVYNILICGTPAGCAGGKLAAHPPGGSKAPEKDHHCCLRNGLSCGHLRTVCHRKAGAHSGGGGHCQRISLPGSHHRRGRTVHRRLPER